MSKITLVCSLLLLGSWLGGCSGDHQPPTTLEQLWRAYPERISSLIDALDLAALPDVKAHLKAADTLGACEELLAHLAAQNRPWVIEALDPMPGKEVQQLARLLPQDSIVLHGVYEKIPRHIDGGWVWHHSGPESDAEFAYSLNTQSYLPALYFAWRENEDPRLVHTFNRIVKDWVLQHPLPEKSDSIYQVLTGNGGLDYRDIGEVEWRTLDTGRRLGSSWVQLFFAFLQHPDFDPAAKVLMLSGIAEQANYLRRHHKTGHNWTTMEMNGLALSGLALPEFKAAEEWVQYALEVMNKEINRQVYPDGVQTELSTKTQWVALRRFESLAKNLQSAGRPISSDYVDRIEEMYQYLAFCMRPDGHQPLNNDSDREDLRLRVLAAAEKYQRTDWVYIATNGREGTRPSRGPSISFPWAGIQIMRGGWEEGSDWAFFDNGPYGTGHQHRDMLHLSISAFGKDLLVDGGRYTHQNYFSFDPAVWRGYFRSSYSHNVILIDGQGQKAGPLVAKDAQKEGKDYVHTIDHDFAAGTFSSGFTEVEGQATHSRSMYYLREHNWLVVDQIQTDRPRRLEVLWHFNPNCKVQLEEGRVYTQNPGEANLQVIPLGGVDWDLRTVQGEESPHYQGWYSETYGKKEANPTVIYQSKIPGHQRFAWLIIATPDTVPGAVVSWREEQNAYHLSYQLSKEDEKQYRLPRYDSSEQKGKD